ELGQLERLRQLSRDGEELLQRGGAIAPRSPLSCHARRHRAALYSSRSAEATGRRAARTAGGAPPARPIKSAKTTPARMRGGVILNANETCENVCQFIVPTVYPWKGTTTMAPMTPPTSAISMASATNERTTAPAPNPIARSVAISRPRSDTAEYIVFRDAN